MVTENSYTRINHKLHLAVLAALPVLALASLSASAACNGSIGSSATAVGAATSISVLCNGTGSSGNLTNGAGTTLVDYTTVVGTSTAPVVGNNVLLQFDGQGRTLNNTGDIINNRVITGTTGTRGRTAILMGSATLNAGSGTLFTTTTTPTTGATTVKLNAAPTTAYVGQTMVFGRYNAGEGDFSLGEQRVITAVNIAAKTVTFATPLTGSYAGSGTDPIGYKVVSNYGAGSTVDGVFYNNVIINSGTVSSQISAAEINGDKTSSSPTITSVSNTAAVKAITASVEGSYLINNTASGIISVKHDGTGNALAIEEGGAVTSMTINNAGLISAERTSHLVLADNFAVTATSPALTTSATSTDYVGFTKQTIGNVNAINTQEEADVLIVNNTSTGVIRSKGDFTGTIYMRAADKTIINDGLIEHVSSAGGADYSKGFAIAAVSDAGEVRDLSLTNNGNIHGDILAVNGNALRWYLLSNYKADGTDDSASHVNLDNRLLINNQYGQSNSEIENAGTIIGNLYYSNGEHTLQNNSTGTITGNIDVDQRKTVDLVSGVATPNMLAGSKEFTFVNEGTFTGHITIRDVAGSVNNITLSGDGFNGEIAATTGAGSNTLNLEGSGTLRDNVSKFTTLNITDGAADWTLASGKAFEFTDAANINAGVLNVLGTLKSNSIVGADATLRGTGTITGNLTNNGTIDLADTTLHITGNTILNAGSKLNTIISASGNGKLAVTGNVTIDTLATLAPTVSGVQIKNGDSFTIATGSAISGLPTVGNSSALIHWDASIVSNNLMLTADVNAANIAGVSSNGASVMNALLAFDNKLGNQVLNLENESDVRKASEQLGPEANNASMQATIAAVDHISALIVNHQDEVRLASSENRGISTGESAQGTSLWMQGFGYKGNQNERNGIDGYTANTGGFAVGVDTVVGNGNFRVGGAIGYASTGIDGDGDGVRQTNRTDIDSYQGTLYGSWNAGAWYLDSALGYGKHQYDTKRYVSLVNASITGSHDANQYLAKIGGGYPMQVGKVTITQMASMTYVKLDQSGYTEKDTSNSGAALNVDSVDSDSLRSGLGAKITAPLSSGKVKTTADARLMWNHEFADTNQDIAARFAGGTSFTTKGMSQARDSASIGLGLNFIAANHQNLSVNYDAEVRSGYIGHTASVKLRIDF